VVRGYAEQVNNMFLAGDLLILLFFLSRNDWAHFHSTDKLIFTIDKI
jgi:hypothetical protein